MLSCPDQTSFAARLFAKLIAAREVRGELALLGLSHEELRALFHRHFGLESAPLDATSQATRVLVQEQAGFVAALRALILQYANAAVDVDDARCLAGIIAHACLRPDHLWRDLGLAGRDEVSAMLERFFPALAARNVDNLRWKRFLAQELALSLGQTPGPAPGCPGCEDYRFCFPLA
ncbi:nitrogen fixation protein NifQ [Paraburkholderia sp. DHOC27]|nr:nitrogen fixation protein NifQ [Paraburkholderia sp. DHOC27]RFU49885.1 nitrogen fixation protein NifQ [Paraburkholderia sp. DHOC27]